MSDNENKTQLISLLLDQCTTHKYAAKHVNRNISHAVDEEVFCLCLTSHQQLRSYGEGATALSLLQQTGEAGNRTCDPWRAVYPLHHGGSYSGGS